MLTEDAQIAVDGPQILCMVCRKPIAGTEGPRRRGRPWRTHPGRCKRVIDARHRVAAFNERVARNLTANGHLERAATFAATAASIRTALGETPVFENAGVTTNSNAESNANEAPR